MYKTQYISKAILLITTIFLTLTLSGVSFAEDKDDSKGIRHIDSFLCKDIMLRSGGDREIAIAFIHGYFVGKKGTTKINTDKLGEASDKFMDYCLDHPKEKAFTVMGKFVK